MFRALVGTMSQKYFSVIDLETHKPTTILCGLHDGETHGAARATQLLFTNTHW